MAQISPQRTRRPTHKSITRKTSSVLKPPHNTPSPCTTSFATTARLSPPTKPRPEGSKRFCRRWPPTRKSELAPPRNVPKDHLVIQPKTNPNQGRISTADPFIRVEETHLSSSSPGISPNSKPPPWTSPGVQNPQSNVNADGEPKPTLPRLKLKGRNIYTSHQIHPSPSPPMPKRLPDAAERRWNRRRTRIAPVSPALNCSAGEEARRSENWTAGTCPS
ncbi:unnamed protein product [Urochloa humidicola]